MNEFRTLFAESKVHKTWYINRSIVQHQSTVLSDIGNAFIELQLDIKNCHVFDSVVAVPMNFAKTVSGALEMAAFAPLSQIRCAKLYAVFAATPDVVFVMECLFARSADHALVLVD